MLEINEGLGIRFPKKNPEVSIGGPKSLEDFLAYLPEGSRLMFEEKKKTLGRAVTGPNLEEMALLAAVDNTESGFVSADKLSDNISYALTELLKQEEYKTYSGKIQKITQGILSSIKPFYEHNGLKIFRVEDTTTDIKEYIADKLNKDVLAEIKALLDSKEYRTFFSYHEKGFRRSIEHRLFQSVLSAGRSGERINPNMISQEFLDMYMDMPSRPLLFKNEFLDLVAEKKGLEGNYTLKRESLIKYGIGLPGEERSKTYLFDPKDVDHIRKDDLRTQTHAKTRKAGHLRHDVSEEEFNESSVYSYCGGKSNPLLIGNDPTVVRKLSAANIPKRRGDYILTTAQLRDTSRVEYVLRDKAIGMVSAALGKPKNLAEVWLNANCGLDARYDAAYLRALLESPKKTA